MKKSNTILLYLLLFVLVALWIVGSIRTLVVHNNNMFFIFLIVSNIILLLLYMYLPIKFIFWIPLIFSIFIFISLFNALYIFNNFYLIMIIYSITLIFFFLLLYKFYKKYTEYEATDKLVIETLNTEYSEIVTQYAEEEKKNRALRKELERMEYISNIAFLLGMIEDFDSFFSQIVESTANIFEDKFVILSLYDKDKGHFTIKKLKGYKEEFIGKETDNIDDWIKESKLPILIKDVNNDMRIKVKSYSRFSKAKSIIASPIFFKKEVIAILRVEDKLPYIFSNEELRLLDYIADISSISYENLYYFKEVEKLAITDSLTGLFVHNYFIERLNSEIERYKINKEPVSLIMLDIDNFKEYNDNYGHQVGDKILICVSNLIRKSIRDIDFPARYGGDEFAIILPGTNIKGAKSVSRRLFENINNNNEISKFAKDINKKHPLSISIGIGEYKNKYKSTSKFISAVDNALYKAKRTGKHKIIESEK